jgi:glycosidase
MKIINYLLFFIILISIITGKVIAQTNYFPEWAKGIVWYQIFPERFANGDKSNDPLPEKVFVNQKNIPEGWSITPWTSNWFAQADWEKKLNNGFKSNLFSRRYGGDIQGIIDHLDYLKKLGIGAIYLNPVFDAVSLHKYDGSTFHHIDVNFGPDPEDDLEIINSETADNPSTWKMTSADKLFIELVNEVHKRGMKIIIDGVFNHTGVQFWAFQDILKNGKDSKYFNWYQIKALNDPVTAEDEFDYKGWWNTRSLPEFNRTKDDFLPEVKKYIFDATRKWMDPNNDGNCDDGIDGWRLDVAREVPIGFWRDWNKLVKEINHQAIIIGELWEISSDFISENGVFDALMNYNFAFAINDYFIADKKQIKTSEFVKKIEEILKSYPSENIHLLQNMLGSHDTERLSSMIANPDRNYDRDGDERNKNFFPGKPSSEVYNRLKLILAFQMTCTGAPIIYYGDEAGMWGADDPHDRKPMVWDNLNYDDEVIDSISGFFNGQGVYSVSVNKYLMEFYKQIISVRNNSNALKFGDIKFVMIDDHKKIFGFKRTSGDERMLVFFNLGTNSELIEYDIDVNSLIDVWNDDKIELRSNHLKFVLWQNSYTIYKY